VVVLDDAFQHRRAGRQEDLVLVSADRWRERSRLLPAGPWREPAAGLSRATLVVVTRKAASADEAQALAGRLGPMTRTGTAAVALLHHDLLRHLHDDLEHPLSRLAGQRVTVIAGVGDPDALSRQLEQIGARVDLLAYPDHHRYTEADVRRATARAERSDWTVCTLKDAVKLRALWPRTSRALWYVSLRCEIEQGAESLRAMVRRLVAARHPTLPITAG
jgi:tetraacyldisaccharide 4'-kinase